MIPADGPSFGIAAAGKCTWMSIYSKMFNDLLLVSFSSITSEFLVLYPSLKSNFYVSIPKSYKFAFIQPNAVITLSFITSPNYPVI